MIVHQPGDASQLHGVSSSHWLIRVGLRRGHRSCDAELLCAIIPTKSTEKCLASISISWWWYHEDVAVYDSSCMPNYLL